MIEDALRQRHIHRKCQECGTPIGFRVHHKTCRKCAFG
jgi:ribosomal protein L37E